MNIIPLDNPRLDNTVYEIVLNYYLLNEPEKFQECIQNWNEELYNPDSILFSINERLKETLSENHMKAIMNAASHL